MSVYDHCPQCRARSQRAAHKDIYRPGDASCRLDSLARPGAPLPFEHPLRASCAVPQRLTVRTELRNGLEETIRKGRGGALSQFEVHRGGIAKLVELRSKTEF